MIFDWLHTLDETATATTEHEQDVVPEGQEPGMPKKEEDSK